MYRDLSDIGFEIDSKKDIYNLALACGDEDNIYSLEDLSFAVLGPDENSELWFYGDEEGIVGTDCVPYYKSPHVIEGEYLCWSQSTEERKGYGMIEIMCDGGDTDFPLNITLPDAFMYEGKEFEDRVRLRMTWFAVDMKIYDDEEDFYGNTDFDLASEACIPCGTFPAPGYEEDFKPTSIAMMNGTVLSAEKRKNEYTGRDYWFVTVGCCGHVFDVVADREFCGEVVAPGNIIEGVFRITGKLTKAEVNTELEGRSQNPELKRPVTAWEMAQIERMLKDLRIMDNEHVSVGFEKVLEDGVMFVQTYRGDEDLYEVEIGLSSENDGEKTQLVGARLCRKDMLEIFRNICLKEKEFSEIKLLEDFEFIEFDTCEKTDSEQPEEEDACSGDFTEALNEALEVYRDDPGAGSFTAVMCMILRGLRENETAQFPARMHKMKDEMPELELAVAKFGENIFYVMQTVPEDRFELTAGLSLKKMFEKTAEDSSVAGIVINPGDEGRFFLHKELIRQIVLLYKDAADLG